MSQGLSEITSSSVFWATLPRQRRGHEAVRGKRFAVLWAIWLHRNEVMFEGKAVSSEGVIQEVEVGWFVVCKRVRWSHRGHGGPSSMVSLPPSSTCIAVHHYG